MYNDFAIATTTGNNAGPSRVFTQTVDTVLMTTKSVNKRLGKHALHLYGSDGTCVFSWLCKRMEMRREVVRQRMGSRGGRGKMIVQGARDGFYFLEVGENGLLGKV